MALYVALLGTEMFVMQSSPPMNGPIPDIDHYRLTHAGLDFLDAWIGARPFDEGSGDNHDAGW